MIAKISSGKNFFGAANYNQQKVNEGKGELLYAQKLRDTSPKGIQESFENRNFSKVKKPVFHVSLSFSAADKVKLDSEKMLKITQEYIQEMGYGQQPYIVYQHNDTAHPHVHVLTSRVDIATQKKLPHSFEQRKSKRITDELEVKYGLTISDKQVLKKRVMVGDIQKAILQHKPENVAFLNKALIKNDSNIRIRATGKGVVYYKVGADGKRDGKALRSSLFKAEGLDKKSLENSFAHHRQDRLYVKDNVEKVLAKSPQINAIAFAQALKAKDIQTEFRFGKEGDKVIGVSYGYKDHTYKGSSLDRNLSWNKTKTQLDFTDIDGLKLRKNLLDQVKAGKPIELDFQNRELQISSGNPTLDKQLKGLPESEAIDISKRFNGYQSSYEQADINGKQLIKGLAEDNLDEYLQRRYKQREQANERRIRR